MRSLRPDQHEALDSLRQAMCDNLKHVVMQASTGFGKTLLAAELVTVSYTHLTLPTTERV